MSPLFRGDAEVERGSGIEGTENFSKEGITPPPFPMRSISDRNVRIETSVADEGISEELCGTVSEALPSP